MQHFTTLSRLFPRQSSSVARQIYTHHYANMSAPKAAETDAQAENAANTTGITTASLQKTLEEKLEAKHVDVEDMSGKIHTSISSIHMH